MAQPNLETKLNNANELTNLVIPGMYIKEAVSDCRIHQDRKFDIYGAAIGCEIMKLGIYASLAASVYQIYRLLNQ